MISSMKVTDYEVIEPNYPVVYYSSSVVLNRGVAKSFFWGCVIANFIHVVRLIQLTVDKRHRYTMYFQLILLWLIRTLGKAFTFKKVKPYPEFVLTKVISIENTWYTQLK